MGVRGEKGDVGVQGAPGVDGSEGIPGLPGIEYVYWKFLCHVGREILLLQCTSAWLQKQHCIFSVNSKAFLRIQKQSNFKSRYFESHSSYHQMIAFFQIETTICLG